MTKVDRDALERAMKIACRDPGRAEQLRGMLEVRSWESVACFAAYHCQTDALNLNPWERPPVHADLPGDRPEDHAARVLLKRLLDAGLSRYEPDPMTALEKLHA